MGKQAKKRRARRGERAVTKTLKRSGVMGRLARVEELFRRPDFRARLDARYHEVEGTDAAPKNVQDVADLALALARDEFGVDTTDCQLTMDWRPDLGRRLMPEFHPSFAAVQRAQDEVASRERSAGAEPRP